MLVDKKTAKITILETNSNNFLEFDGPFHFKESFAQNAQTLLLSNLQAIRNEVKHSINTSLKFHPTSTCLDDKSRPNCKHRKSSGSDDSWNSLCFFN